MNQIAQNYLTLKDGIHRIAIAAGRNPNDITLLPVTKGVSNENILEVYKLGNHSFGENRLQEALEKIPQLPGDIDWQLIGTLQSNKVVKALQFFSLIHSLDSLELAKKISSVSIKLSITARVLLQVNTSGELSKHGMSAEDWRRHLDELNQLDNIQIEGLMTIAPYIEDEKVIRSCFSSLRRLKDEFKGKIKDSKNFSHLSMGMSHDYRIAIEEGATILRIGTAIFGERVDNST